MGCCNSKLEEDHTVATGNVANTIGNSEQQGEEAAALLGAQQGLSSRVQISIACSNLAKLDRKSRSDPVCVMYIRTGQQEEWGELGRTEIIANTQDPHFITQLHLMYHFEEVQHLKFTVLDVDADFTSADSKTLDITSCDFQGSAEVVVSQMVGVNGKGNWTAPLIGGQDSKGKSAEAVPTITVTAEEAANVNALVKLSLRGEDLVKLDMFSKSDPFVRISRQNEDDTWTPCFRTEMKKDTSQPIWNLINSSVQQLANGDIYRKLRMECFDYDESGNHQLIGICEASINDIATMLARAEQTGSAKLPLVDPAKKGTAGYTDSGKLIFDACNLEYQPSFLEYIRGGSELCFITAIDFTASNGDPMTPGTLHYNDPTGQRLNQYSQAILGVGQVLEFYDSDKLFPVYGFGAKLGPGQPVSHCFALNFNEQHPDQHAYPGVAGIMSTYHASLQRLTMNGPTYFSNILSQAAALAESQASSGKYYVLLILTDGIINDMTTTVETIVAASSLPLSILIIGVGEEADFTNMHTLDCDGSRLVSETGRTAERDIVQFVEISRFYSSLGTCNQYELAKKLLAEIPGQFLSYMASRQASPSQLNLQVT